MKICKPYKMGIILLVMLTTVQVSCARKIANVYPLDKSYYREDRLVRDLTLLAKDNSSFVKLHNIGITSADKKPIYALQIQTDINRQPVMIVGQHHGDEVLGVEVSMAFADRLLRNPDDDRVQNLLGKYSFWIIPTLNPDAWKIVTSGKYQWKRKNNADSNDDGRLNVKTDGVDLNRNYPLFWELDKNKPESSPYYKGSGPASESEIQAIIELASMITFKYAFFYHSSVSGTYSETLYLPWQDSKDKEGLQDFINMRKLAQVYAKAVPREYSPGTYSVHPGNTSKIGNSRNYFFYEWGTYAYDVEVGGVGKLGAGVIHPRSNIRASVVQSNIEGLITLLLHPVR